MLRRALQAQQLPGHKHSKCWSVGQWGDGRKVSISLIDPSDPTQGIVYTMLQGDTKGCPGGMCVCARRDKEGPVWKLLRVHTH